MQCSFIGAVIDVLNSGLAERGRAFLLAKILYWNRRTMLNFDPTHNKFLFTNHFITMTLQEEVRSLAIEQVKFTNKEREALVEAQNESYGELHRSVLEFEKEAETAEVDATEGAKALVKLAGKFGNQTPDITPDQAEETKELINEIYDNPNNEALETKGEQLFSKALDFIIRTKELNKFEESQGVGQ